MILDNLFSIRNNTVKLKKIIRVDKRAEKEIHQFPPDVQVAVSATLNVLARDGRLEEPVGKKIDKELFEIRIRYHGQWRVLYAYVIDQSIVVLSAFQKKTQKTPVKEINKARQRMRIYATLMKH